MSDALRPLDVVRVRGGTRADAIDRVATEEPLEVRVHGRPFAVIMRTPGADRELAAGFLFAERVLRSADDLGAIEHCRDPEGSQTANVVNVTLTPGARDGAERMLAERRLVGVNSSCGLCGRQTIESLRTEASPVICDRRVSAFVVTQLPDRLRGAQPVFDETGGLHAAGVFTTDGVLEASAEDVGRHNAVDKVIGGSLMKDALPLSDRLLFVSGRTSFEIVQKGVFAGIPIVLSVSAPSSLAVELAVEMGVTLVGFVRGDGFNIYSHAERIARA